MYVYAITFNVFFMHLLISHNAIQGCPTPLDVADASKSYTGTYAGDKATYTCDSGFSVVSGDVIHTCTDVGTWTGSLPVCQGNHVVSKRIILRVVNIR